MNLAVRRTPKPHVTIKYLEPDFTELFLNGLRGLAPDGSRTPGSHGRELARNAAVGGLGAGHRAAAGRSSPTCCPGRSRRCRPAPATVPIPFPVPAGVTKGRKFRTTWISYEALAGVHQLPGAGPGRHGGRLGVAAAARGGASRCW